MSTANQNHFTVRISRLFLLLLVFIGALFLLTGLDLAIFHRVFEPAGTQHSPLVQWLFAAFMTLIGTVICATQLWYLVFPPTMLRVTNSTISFGTGLRYHQYELPLKNVQSVSAFEKISDLEVMEEQRTVPGGVEIQFNRNAGLPFSMATSAGISYSDYTLRLKKAYMDKSIDRVVDELKQLRKI